MNPLDIVKKLNSNNPNVDMELMEELYLDPVKFYDYESRSFHPVRAELDGEEGIDFVFYFYMRKEVNIQRYDNNYYYLLINGKKIKNRSGWDILVHEDFLYLYLPNNKVALNEHALDFWSGLKKYATDERIIISCQPTLGEKKTALIEEEWKPMGGTNHQKYKEKPVLPACLIRTRRQKEKTMNYYLGYINTRITKKIKQYMIYMPTIDKITIGESYQDVIAMGMDLLSIVIEDTTTKPETRIELTHEEKKEIKEFANEKGNTFHSWVLIPHIVDLETLPEVVV